MKKEIHGSIWIFAALICFALSPYHVANASGGAPPPSICGRTIALSVASPESVVLMPNGAKVEIDALLFLESATFLNASGSNADSCLPKSLQATFTFKSTCDIPERSATMTTQETIRPGFNRIKIPVTFPSGPPRVCEFDVTAVVEFPDGTTLQEISESSLCLVDGSQKNPEHPHLRLQRISDPISMKHPGDQGDHVFVLSNNTSKVFRGSVEVTIQNDSRLPEVSGNSAPGFGVYSISDPVQGDEFPIGFSEDLGPSGCLPLPESSADLSTRTVQRPIMLKPMSSETLNIYSRSWGLSAKGATGQGLVRVKGVWIPDRDSSKYEIVSAGFVQVVDPAALPDFVCVDSSVTTPAIVDLAKPTILTHSGQPALERSWRIDSSFGQAQLWTQTGNATMPVRIAVSKQAAGTLSDGRSRHEVEITGPNGGAMFSAESAFDFAFDLQFEPSTSAAPKGLEILEYALVAGRPTDFESQAPYAKGVIAIDEETKPTQADSFFDFQTQISAETEVLGVKGRNKVIFSQVDVDHINKDGKANVKVKVKGALTIYTPSKSKGTSPARDRIKKLILYIDLRTAARINPNADASGVRLTSFVASADTYRSPVNITWSTDLETGRSGFNVYQAKKNADGKFTKGKMINLRMIAAKGNALSGEFYAVRDDEAISKGEDRWYYLEDVDVDGNATLHGPEEVIVVISQKSAEELKTDSDGDGFSDWYEEQAGTDPSDASKAPAMGDLNGDGKTGQSDSMLLYRRIKQGNFTPEEAKKLDVNLDGKVDKEDAMILYKWTAKQPGYESLPIIPKDEK